MVDKIFGNKGFGPLAPMGRTDKTAAAKKSEGARGQDRVDFSSALQQAEQTQATSTTRETARMEKIAALKQQIESGTYKPDLNKVAASLLPFLAKES